MKKPITVALLKDLLNQCQRDEITFSKMVEVLNEESEKAYEVGKEKQFTNEECHLIKNDILHFFDSTDIGQIEIHNRNLILNKIKSSLGDDYFKETPTMQEYLKERGVRSSELKRDQSGVYKHVAINENEEKEVYEFLKKHNLSHCATIDSDGIIRKYRLDGLGENHLEDIGNRPNPPKEHWVRFIGDPDSGKYAFWKQKPKKGVSMTVQRMCELPFKEDPTGIELADMELELRNNPDFEFYEY